MFFFSSSFFFFTELSFPAYKQQCKLSSETQTIDHTGGCLQTDNFSLKIPQGALKKGQKEDITLQVLWNEEQTPVIQGRLKITPTVRCLPTGLKFLKPVEIRVPNLREVKHPEQCKSEVYCNEEDVGMSQIRLWLLSNIIIAKRITAFFVCLLCNANLYHVQTHQKSNL